MNRKHALALAFAAGLLAALAGAKLWETARHIARMPAPSTAARPLPTEAWPTAPATVTAGTPNFRGTVYAVAADGKTLSGTWAADGPSRFSWHYPVDESIYIHEGRVELDYLGHRFALVPGDTAFFHAGTTAHWTVPEKVRKSWTIHAANPLVRWWRRLAGTEQPA